MQLSRHDPVAALLHMLTGGCKRTLLLHDVDGDEIQPACEKSRMLVESAAEYALLKIACHCEEDFKEHMLKVCLSYAWMGHNVPIAHMLL